ASSDSLGSGAGVRLRRAVAVMEAGRPANRSAASRVPTWGGSPEKSGKLSAIWVRSLSSIGVPAAGVPVPADARAEASGAAAVLDWDESGNGTGDLLRGASGANALRFGPVARRPSALW